jgi:3-deoxy-D-manno-octulosonic-acid transferase
MPAVKDSPLLGAYRLASAGLGLGAPLYLYWRGKIGHDDFSRRHERLGQPYLARPDGRLALLHMASGGEALIVLPLVEKLGQLGFCVLLSVRDLACPSLRGAGLPQCLHQLSPLDVPQFMARFLDHWRPDIVLISGPEILSNLIIEASVRKIPIALVNACLSGRSFMLMRKFSGFAEALLRRVDCCLARASADAERFASLGMRNVQVTGNLKYDGLPAPVDQSALARLLAQTGTRPAWVADETYPGEEEIVIAAHRQLARQFPGLLTVIVPHNPKRAFEVAQIAAKMGLVPGLGSADCKTTPLPEIYIARAAAEAELFYRAAGVVFAGKSLCCGGGNNPVEPASLGCAILHGPDVEDFEEIYAALDEAGGAALACDAETLAEQLLSLFSDKAALRAMGRAAAATAEAFGGGSDRIIQALAPYLAQLMIAKKGGEG